MADKYYIGSTSDLGRRMVEHNEEGVGYTRKYRPWVVIYSKDFLNRAQAMKLEKYLKSLKNKERLRQYIAGWRSSTSGGS